MRTTKKRKTPSPGKPHSISINQRLVEATFIDQASWEDAVTVFPSAVKDTDDFLLALRAGGFYPAIGLKHGRLTPFAKVVSK